MKLTFFLLALPLHFLPTVCMQRQVNKITFIKCTHHGCPFMFHTQEVFEQHLTENHPEAKSSPTLNRAIKSVRFTAVDPTKSPKRRRHTPKLVFTTPESRAPAPFLPTPTAIFSTPLPALASAPQLAAQSQPAKNEPLTYKEFCALESRISPEYGVTRSSSAVDKKTIKKLRYIKIAYQPCCQALDYTSQEFKIHVIQNHPELYKSCTIPECPCCDHVDKIRQSCSKK